MRESFAIIRDISSEWFCRNGGKREGYCLPLLFVEPPTADNLS